MKNLFYMMLHISLTMNLLASEYTYKQAYSDDVNWPSHVTLSSKLNLPAGVTPLSPGMQVTLVGAKESGLLLVIGDFQSLWIPHQETDFLEYYAKIKSSSEIDHRARGSGLTTQLARRSFCYDLNSKRAVSEALLNKFKLFILPSRGLLPAKDQDLMSALNNAAASHKNLGFVIAADELMPKSNFHELCKTKLPHTVVLLPVYSPGFIAALLDGRGPLEKQFLLLRKSGKLLFQSDDLTEIINYAKEQIEYSSNKSSK